MAVSYWIATPGIGFYSFYEMFDKISYLYDVWASNDQILITLK